MGLILLIFLGWDAAFGLGVFKGILRGTLRVAGKCSGVRDIGERAVRGGGTLGEADGFQGISERLPNNIERRQRKARLVSGRLTRAGKMNKTKT